MQEVVLLAKLGMEAGGKRRMQLIVQVDSIALVVVTAVTRWVTGVVAMYNTMVASVMGDESSLIADPSSRNSSIFARGTGNSATKAETSTNSSTTSSLFSFGGVDDITNLAIDVLVAMLCLQLQWLCAPLLYRVFSEPIAFGCIVGCYTVYTAGTHFCESS